MLHIAEPLQRAAIHIARVRAPARVVQHLSVLSAYWHASTYAPICENATCAKELLVVVREGLKRLTGDAGRASDLRLVWDTAAGLSSASTAIREELARDTELRDDGAFLLAVILARVNAAEGVDYFLRALREQDWIEPGNALPRRLAQHIADTLASSSHRPHALLRRRAATYFLRFLPQAERLRLARIGLTIRHESPFVRRNVASSLLAIRDRSAYHELAVTLERLGSANPGLADLLLDALVMLDPQGSIGLCARYVHHPDPELRGRAPCWLGELQRRFGRPLSDRALRLRLLEALPMREHAMNVAQLMIAPMGLSSALRDLEDLGMDPRYRAPLWRTHWG